MPQATNKRHKFIEEILNISPKQRKTAEDHGAMMCQYCDLIQHDQHLENTPITDDTLRLMVGNILSAYSMCGAHNINLHELLHYALAKSLVKLSENQE